jgi:hypothetical protein
VVGIQNASDDACVTVTLDGGAPITTPLVDGRFQVLTDQSITAFVVGPTVVRRVGLEADLDDGGSLAQVIVAGRASVDAILAGAAAADPPQNPTEVRNLVESFTDLEVEARECNAMSLTYSAEALP